MTSINTFDQSNSIQSFDNEPRQTQTVSSLGEIVEIRHVFSPLLSRFIFCNTAVEIYSKLGMKTHLEQDFLEHSFQDFELVNRQRIFDLYTMGVLPWDTNDMYMTEDEDLGFAMCFYDYWNELIEFYDLDSRQKLEKQQLLEVIFSIREEIRQTVLPAQEDNNPARRDNNPAQEDDDDLPNYGEDYNPAQNNDFDDLPDYDEDNNPVQNDDDYNAIFAPIDQEIVDAPRVYRVYIHNPEYEIAEYREIGEDPEYPGLRFSYFATHLRRRQNIDPLPPGPEPEPPVELEEGSMFVFSPYYICCTWTDVDAGEDVFEEDPCPICFEVVHRSRTMRTKCGHIFCRTCIDQVVQHAEKYNCPMCRCSMSHE